MAESKAMLKWRSKQSEGAIMKPSTFKEIAARYGGEKGQNAAGAAYWQAARAKYRKYKRRKAA